MSLYVEAWEAGEPAAVLKKKSLETATYNSSTLSWSIVSVVLVICCRIRIWKLMIAFSSTLSQSIDCVSVSCCRITIWKPCCRSPVRNLFKLLWNLQLGIVEAFSRGPASY